MKTSDNGKKLIKKYEGLVNRRKDEREVFLK